MIKNFFILIFLLVSSSCKSDKTKNNNDINHSVSLNISKNEEKDTQNEKDIKYKLLSNYFAKVDSLSNPKITNNEEFNEYFGMATTLNNNGKPTPIDFDEEFVIAIIHPSTNKKIELLPNGLEKDNEKLPEEYLIFNYLIIDSGENSFQTRPCLLISVNKKYDFDIIINPQKIIAK